MCSSRHTIPFFEPKLLLLTVFRQDNKLDKLDKLDKLINARNLTEIKTGFTSDVLETCAMYVREG